jgi:hypothetical protein
VKKYPLSFLAVLIGAVVLAASSANSLAAGSSALIAQINALPSLEQRLEFIETHPVADASARAAIAAAVIQSAPAERRSETAMRVVELLVKQNPRPADSGKFAALVAKDLPKDLAVAVAPAIIMGAGKADSAHLPKITADVILSQSATIRNAAEIARYVVAASPVSRASDIATAIGMAFSSSPQLASEAPEIAAGFARALVAKIPKETTVPEARSALADSVAALVVLLPGSVRSNHNLIVRIGREVAAVIGHTQPGMATTVVGITSAALKSAAGTSDITLVLNDFRDEFKKVIDDPVILAKLDRVTSEIVDGTSDKTVKPLDPVGEQTELPVPGILAVGPITTPETPVANR